MQLVSKDSYLLSAFAPVFTALRSNCRYFLRLYVSAAISTCLLACAMILRIFVKLVKVSIFADILAAAMRALDVREMFHVFESTNKQSTFATHYPNK